MISVKDENVKQMKGKENNVQRKRKLDHYMMNNKILNRNAERHKIIGCRI